MGQLDYLINYEGDRENGYLERLEHGMKRSEERRRIETYAAERYNPTLPFCGGGIQLYFDGKQLIMIKTTGPDAFVRKYNAVSGLPDSNNKFDYSVDRQKKADVGPIPEGKYWINPAEFWERDWYNPFSKNAYGDYRITIHPFVDTQTHGSRGPATGLYIPRGGFFIHGGKTPGSKGCIDLTGGMDQFYKDVKQAIGSNTKCQIQLVVKYK